MNIAIITGASSGMGREFVLELDKTENFDEIWVIARRRERLDALSGLTRAKIRPVCLDLTSPESTNLLAEMLKAESPRISVLVNAAGFGYFKAFTELPLSDQLNMIDLNEKALIAVTYVCLPYMDKGCCIYNLGSLSSFQPVPYINVYGASKAFVLSYSRALNVELRPRGIRVMAVCPGWVKTEFFNTAVSDDTITYYNRYYEANEVVVRAIKDMKRGRDVSICGFPIRLQVLGVKLLPHKLVMRIWCGQQKKPK